MNPHELNKEITKELINRGKVIEAGWLGFKTICIPKYASEAQLRDMRIAFFAGALHIFTSILSTLDPGKEPTEEDMKRIDKIHGELEEFQRELEKSIRRGN